MYIFKFAHTENLAGNRFFSKFNNLDSNTDAGPSTFIQVALQKKWCALLASLRPSQKISQKSKTIENDESI